MSSDFPMMETHPVSKRTVVFEDDGTSAWLYLTQPNSYQPVRDCWIYNRIPPPNPSEVENYRGGPPPACIGYVDAKDTFTDPAMPDVSFVWSKTGNDVAVRVNGVVLGFLSSQLTAGYSKLLLRDGPWGRVWKETMYAGLFGTDG